MSYKSGILLGRITKINKNGSVTVRLEKNFIENIPEMGTVFLEIEGKPVPFFISEYDYPGSDVIRLTFEDYNVPEKIIYFKGCRVFLTSDEKISGITSGIPEIKGFKVLDENKKLLGTIREIIENPAQLIINVISPSDQEILIPLHDDLIIDIDESKKIIIMTIPEGLTELN